MAGEPAQAGFDSQPLPKRAGALYAAAMAQAQLRDLPKAQALAAQLAHAVADDARGLRQARLLQADLALQAGQPAKALEWLPAKASGTASGAALNAWWPSRSQAWTSTVAALSHWTRAIAPAGRVSSLAFIPAKLTPRVAAS